MEASSHSCNPARGRHPAIAQTGAARCGTSANPRNSPGGHAPSQR